MCLGHDERHYASLERAFSNIRSACEEFEFIERAPDYKEYCT